MVILVGLEPRVVGRYRIGRVLVTAESLIAHQCLANVALSLRSRLVVLLYNQSGRILLFIQTIAVPPFSISYQAVSSS